MTQDTTLSPSVTPPQADTDTSAETQERAPDASPETSEGTAPAPPEVELLTLAEAARLVGLSDRALRKRVYKGLLEARRDVRGGRAVMVVRRDHLEALFGNLPAGPEAAQAGPDRSGPAPAAAAGGREERVLRSKLDKAMKSLELERKVRARVKGELEQERADLAKEREELARERDERRRVSALLEEARGRADALETELEAAREADSGGGRRKAPAWVWAASGLGVVLLAWALGQGISAVRNADATQRAADLRMQEAEALFQRAQGLLDGR